MPYDYVTEMCAEIMPSGKVYKPAAPIAKPSRPEPTLPPPASKPTGPTTEEPTAKATPSTTKKDQPTANITAQLKKVKADISIWDLIHTSSEHREAFLHVFQAAHVSRAIEPATLESMVGMIAEP